MLAPIIAVESAPKAAAVDPTVESSSQCARSPLAESAPRIAAVSGRDAPEDVHENVIAEETNVMLDIDIVATAIRELGVTADANIPALSRANTDAAPRRKEAGTWKVALPAPVVKVPIGVEIRVPASMPL